MEMSRTAMDCITGSMRGVGREGVEAVCGVQVEVEVEGEEFWGRKPKNRAEKLG